MSLSTGASPIEKLDQYHAGDEATDVRRVRNTTLLRTAAKHSKPAYQLEQEPDSDRDISWYVREKTKQDHRHTSFRMQQEVTTQHARDREGPPVRPRQR